MKKIPIFLFVAAVFLSCDFSKYKLVKEYDFTTVFEKSEGKKTATYEEIIAYYEELDDAFTTIELREIGVTDSGEPLHLALFNPEADFDLDYYRKNKTIVLINNGIHPGESDGIDASMMLLRDLAQDSVPVPENVILAVIPVYNVGGALLRNSTTRTNQNGPEEYGFRGNAKNYDLNRDFIKADTRNTLSFYEIFHLLKPDIFIDTHVSNGADYQYTLTHLFTQHDKMGGQVGNYIEQKMLPELEKDLENKNWPSTPYVNVFNEVPEKGFTQFMDYPRYSTGYASLWNTIGVMVETHMLKPYKQRVEGTYDFLASVISFADQNATEIKQIRANATVEFSELKKYPVRFKVDSSQTRKLQFKGYEPEIATSEVSGLYRLKYNTDKPFTKEVDYYNKYIPTATVDIPAAYVIPQTYSEVIKLLTANRIEMQQFEKDSIFEAEVYFIKDYETVNQAFEGHYLHYNTKVRATDYKVKVRKGDYIVPTNQVGIKYIMETLEPEAVDSFFNWNFFDAILQQKEGYSAYVFEDIAAKFLEENPQIKEAFEKKKKSDFSFSRNSRAQLDWIYKQTTHYELQHLRYPIFRLR